MDKVNEDTEEQVHKGSESVQRKIYEGEKKVLDEASGSDMDQTAKDTTLEPGKNADNIAANISIFDDKEFSTTDECVQYMTETFGFFIPDVERLIDLEGLLVYLGEKVKLGGYCLYCQEVLAPGKPCQDHMVSASHCKLRYEVGVDRDEYEDFYEYEVSADDGAVEDNMDTATMSKLAPDDDRVQEDVDVQQRKPVLDPLRKELLRLGSKFGDLNFSAEELVRMGDAEVIAMLVKYQQDIRKSQMTEQRLQQLEESKNQRLEFKDRKAKARTSKMVAEKISSYHGMLM